MATIFRKPGSPFWWTAFFDRTGKRRYLSTKKVSKTEAAGVAAELEKRSRKIEPEDDERNKRVLRLVEEAADLALRGTLSESAAQGILNRMMEASTGESLRNVTIADWLRGWVSEKRRAKSKGTSVRYEGVIESFLGFLPAAKRSQPLAALAVSDIRGFRDRLLAEGRAAATANVAVKILRGPLNLARRQGLISNNPAEAVEMVSVGPSERDVFSPDEVSRMIGVADAGWKGLILAGYYTGARLGDLIALTWENVDFERMTIAFRQRKTRRFVEVPIHGELLGWLEARPGKNASDPVFPVAGGSKTGGAHGLSERFKTVMRKAGIEFSVGAKSGKMGRQRASLSFHSLRHSFNSAMANAGVTQEIRQRLTGHASKAINDRYTHTELETLRKAVAVVPRLS
jgi:integrase